jgi:TonB-dependent receptor
MKSKPLSIAVRSLLALAAASAGVAGSRAVAQEEDLAAGAADGRNIEEIVVIGRQQSSAEQILQERMELDVVADLVAAEQIARVGDSTVSLALRRLPAVTVVGDQFIYIRGLGERYSSTTVNGAQVPSPDLTRNVIPLDLFPAEIVETLSIQKGFSPEQPAAFGGGSIDIRTRSIPDDPLLVFQVGTGWNSENSGRGLDYNGGGDDRWGTDDGTRALPKEIKQAINDYQGDLSASGILQGLRRDGGSPTLAEAEQINRELITSMNRDIDFKKTSLDPDLGLELAAGNTWAVGDSGDWTIGAIAVGDYKNQWRDRDRTVRGVTNPQKVVTRSQRTTNLVTVTGAGSVGLDYAGEQRVQATYIYLRNTEDEATLSVGNNENFQQASGDQLRSYRIRYEERNLDLLQFHGKHTLGPATRDLLGGLDSLEFLDGLSAGWYYSDATATTDLPSEILVSAVDQVNPVTGDLIQTSIRPSTSSADYRYTDLEDDATSYGVYVAMPFETDTLAIEASGGYDYYEKGRSYLQTQLNFGTTSQAALPSLVGTPGQVFTDPNILDPGNQYALGLGGIGTESYLAGETIDAGWGKVDLTWNETWRLMAGARWENFSRVTVPIDQYEFDTTVGKIRVPLDQIERAATSEDDFYPAAALTWMRDDLMADRFQLRFGWSQTTARPDLREVSDATYIDPLTEARVRGNPDLEPSDLSNFDLRGEWYFDDGDNLTVSLFYKQIDAPIETVAAAGTDDNIALTYINADSADLYGIELEWLYGLGWLSPESGLTDGFFLSGNVTLSDSEITIGDAAPDLTNDKRRLSQHAPWVVNLQLGYDSLNERHSASVAYNAFGERLFFAGRGGAPDAYEQPFHSLDLIYSYYPIEPLSLKFRVQNLLDQNTTIEQGGVKVLEQTVGLTYKFDMTYRF